MIGRMIGDHLTIFDRDHILVLYKIDTPATHPVQLYNVHPSPSSALRLGYGLLVQGLYYYYYYIIIIMMMMMSACRMVLASYYYMHIIIYY
jgi:hypothetical protein